jgi:hypothetical protein
MTTDPLSGRPPLKRPPLRQIALEAVIPYRPGLTYVTMSPRQWDDLLQSAYDAGFVLLEVDRDEKPLAAYRRLESGA